jgi:uncharacterized protein (DUF697 family)
VPDAVHQALAAAQRIDTDAKARAAQTFIGGSVTAAAAAAATPIPFSSAAVLVPIQLAMMARITHLYNVPFDRASIAAIASTAVATTAGRAAFTSLIKLVPGAGTVLGGAISAGIASTFTFAMGEAWLVVCQRAAAGSLPNVDGVIDNEAVRVLFETEFRKRVPGVRRQEESSRL